MRSLLHFPDKFDHGIASLAGPHLKQDGSTFVPRLGLFAPFEQVLSTPFPTDAHCVFYCLREKDGTLSACPLLRKAVLPDIKAAGCEVVSIGFGLDFDTVGHVPLDDDHLAALYEKLSAAWDKDTRLGNWAAWYTTRHGARVVYMLSEPVPAVEGEGRLITLQRAYKAAGIEPDPLVDWTRRFRLPSVLRDGVHTGQEKLHMCEVVDREIPVKDLPPSARKTLARLRTFKPSGDYPSQEECRKRLYQSGKNGRETRTRFHDRAVKALRDTSLHACLFEEAPLPDEGRHEWLLSAFGVAVPKLLRSAYASAEDIFALFYDPILQWDPATCQQDPHAHAWDILQHIYGNEVPLYNREQEEIADKAATSEGVLHGMIEGMRAWCDAPDLGDDMPMETREAFVKRHIFANMDTFYYPLNRHGYYSSMCRTKDQLIPFIRTSHLSGIVETRKLNKDGVLVSVPVTEIVNDHATVVNKTKARPQMPSEGYIEDLDGDKPVLMLPMYRRNPGLSAQFDAEVDGWLREFFGRNYAAGARWIGYALDFEGGPICALSLDSVPSSGKKLLVSGLSECLQEPMLLPGKSIGDKHAAELMESPFVNVNEAWPSMESFDSPSERFKQVVAGDDISVEPKFKGKVIINNPLRVVMTANGNGLMTTLVAGQNMTPTQRESVGIRILHLKVSDDAVRYLWSIGGMGGTTRPGRRWIRGDCGEPSDFVVARHFLWLYENRPGRDTRERFVMMGNCGGGSEEMEMMSGQSEDMPKVMRGLIEILSNPQMNMKHFVIREGRLGFTRFGVLWVVRSVMDERIKEAELEDCLAAIAKTLEPMVVDGREFVELDAEAIVRYGRKWGMDMKAALKTLETLRK